MQGSTIGRMEAAERLWAVERLRAGRDALLDAVRDVSDEQGKFKPAQDQWSIEEVVEHLATTEHGMYRLITAHFQPLDAPADRGREEAFTRRGLDRSQKWDAPEHARPRGRYGCLSNALRQFRENRERTLAWMDGCEDDLRMRAVEHPVGRISGHECLLLLINHPMRHADQIREIKQSAGYHA